jgi:aromatic ring-opening dioxygenase catalytic subunit (LigB family)
MPSLFLCQVSPKLLAGDPNKEQTSKQASTRAINFKPLAIVNR